MIRHARMRGHAALFLPGLDHASIAAQFVLDAHPREGGREPPVARPRALPRADDRVLGLDPARDARPAAAGRRVGRLGAAALHDGRGVGQVRARRVRAPVPRRPRVPDRGARQLVPGLPDERQRPRGRADARDRDPVARPLPPGRRGDRRARSRSRAVGRRRDHPTRDDPGRHGRGRASRRRALPRPRRPARADPVRRPRRADHRRRGRGHGVRHGRREDHARPRPGRSRDRQAPRPARPDDPRRRCHRREHGDRIRWPRPIRGAPPDRGGPDGSWRSRRGAGPRDDRRALPAQRRRPGATAQDAVVHPHGAAGGTSAGRHAVGAHHHPARAIREDLGALAHEHPRLEREPAAVVGPSHPRVVLPRWPHHGHGRPGRPGGVRNVRARGRASSSRTRTSSTRGSARACGRSRPSAGRTRRPTTPATTRRRSWRPATTSSSSGSPG